MNTLLTLIISFLISNSSAIEVKKITFASPEDLPPRIFKENGVLRGTYVDIITAVCKRMNVTPIFIQYPWNRSIAMVKSGKVDAILPIFKTSEREEFLYFPSVQVSRTRNAIFAQKVRKIKITKLDDLKKYTVGIIDNYSYGPEFDQLKSSLKIELNNSEEIQIKKLAHQGQVRMDVAAVSEEPFHYLSHKLGLSQKFETVYLLSETPSYVAFSKAGGQGNKKLANEFGKVFKQLQDEGVIKKINDQYFK